MTASDDPANRGRQAPSNRGDETAALLHEAIEALTALGNYLTVAQHEFENQPGLIEDTLGEALRKSLDQYERAVKAVRRLRQLAL
jgi:phosphoglycerate-specific signal transduction histidine kinase